MYRDIVPAKPRNTVQFFEIGSEIQVSLKERFPDPHSFYFFLNPDGQEDECAMCNNPYEGIVEITHAGIVYRWKSCRRCIPSVQGGELEHGHA